MHKSNTYTFNLVIMTYSLLYIRMFLVLGSKLFYKQTSELRNMTRCPCCHGFLGKNILRWKKTRFVYLVFVELQWTQGKLCSADMQVKNENRIRVCRNFSLNLIHSIGCCKIYITFKTEPKLKLKALAKRTHK